MASHPTYHVHRATEPIVIDGVLDERDWRAAEVVQLRETVTGTEPKQVTSLRLLWDASYLYVGFECSDTDIYSPYTERDDPLWESEVVEVFIDDNCNGITYLEFEINPRNALVDLYVVNRNLERDDIRFMIDWNSRGIRHATTVDGDATRRGTKDRSWTVEWAIPWEDCATAPHLPPQNGDAFRANFYRIDRGPTTDEDEYSAWSPTGAINFHRPDRFGTIVFSTDSVR